MSLKTKKSVGRFVVWPELCRPAYLLPTFSYVIWQVCRVIHTYLHLILLFTWLNILCFDLGLQKHPRKRLVMDLMGHRLGTEIFS